MCIINQCTDCTQCLYQLCTNLVPAVYQLCKVKGKFGLFSRLLIPERELPDPGHQSINTLSRHCPTSTRSDTRYTPATTLQFLLSNLQPAFCNQCPHGSLDRVVSDICSEISKDIFFITSNIYWCSRNYSEPHYITGIIN